MQNRIAVLADWATQEHVERLFEPGCSKGVNVRIGQVEVAVPIDVDGSQPEGVAVLVREQVLGKADWLTSIGISF